MAMVLSKMSYRHKLFVLVMGLSWIIVACFMVFQYSREKQYKAERLDERLQLFNMQVVDAIEGGKSPREFLTERPLPIEGLRVTVIDTLGSVIYDTHANSTKVTNHLDRPEVKMALETGTGFTRNRHSDTTNDVYFYSAMADGNIIVRSAAPYTLTLEELLAVDKNFLWFLLLVTAITSITAYLATRKLGMNISRLNRFARRAEAGEKFLDDKAFPHDELGEISQHIVRLYVRQKEQYELMTRQEQEKSRLKRELTNNINHELKTPVAALQVCIETMVNHPDLDSVRRESILSRCTENIGRLKSMLADVSTLTRLEDGNAEIAHESVNLNMVIREVAGEYDDDAYMPIVFNLGRDIILHGNRSLLAASFRNLINNAIAYSRGDLIEITQPDDYTIVFVDNGVGVPDQYLSRIFERFFRIDKGRSREFGGTGLGLAIVKHTIALHGGTIEASNRPEGGLQFTMRFQSGDV